MLDDGERVNPNERVTVPEPDGDREFLAVPDIVVLRPADAL